MFGLPLPTHSLGPFLRAAFLLGALLSGSPVFGKLSATATVIPEKIYDG